MCDEIINDRSEHQRVINQKAKTISESSERSQSSCKLLLSISSAYRRQLRKDIVERTLNDLPESPFHATPVRKKAPSAGRKEKESRSNKQPRRQQQSTPIEQNPQLDDNDNDQPNDYDQPDESNAPFAANQNPASTLFSFSNETMNRIVDGGRILLELIIKFVKNKGFENSKIKSSFAELHYAFIS